MTNQSEMYPPDFDEWPLGQQIAHVEMRYTRVGLLRRLLNFAGCDNIEVKADTKLAKRELAALFLEAVDGRESGYPADFETWNKDRQIEHIIMRYTRKGLIVAVLSYAGLSTRNYDLNDDSKMPKEQLQRYI